MCDTQFQENLQQEAEWDGRVEFSGYWQDIQEKFNWFFYSIETSLGVFHHHDAQVIVGLRTVHMGFYG